MKNLFPIILVLVSFFNQNSLKAAANFSVNDSTFQKVIEFTDPNKKLKKNLFFKTGDEVIIRTKHSSKRVKGKIQGFTKDGIIINGATIPIKDITTIRVKSITSLFLSGFSYFFIAISGIATIIGNRALNSVSSDYEQSASTLVRTLMYIPVMIFLVLFLIVSFGIFLLGIILAMIGSLAKYNNKFFNLKKCQARIKTKKLPKESAKKKKKKK